MEQQRRIAPSGFASPAVLAGMPTETAVLLGFSGGADSRLLLHLLAADAREQGYTLTLAHVNHGIRGDEALRDRAFCETLAEQYGLELCILDADVPSLAKDRGMGLEETGRAVRYEYFEALMAERHIPLLATAHHADDNLETVIFRLARGTGLGGLAGISPCRPFGGGYLTRPLLGMSKQRILELCAEYGLQYVTDSTNLETDAARNRIRAEVIPTLEMLFDDPQSRVYRMTEGLREDEMLLRELAEALLARVRLRDGLLLEPLQQAPTPLQRRALAAWCREQTSAEPERVHLDALMRLIGGETPHAQVALPCGYVALAELGVLRVESKAEVDDKPFRLPLTEGETILVSGIRISVEKIKKSSKVHNMYTESCIMIYRPFDAPSGEYYWRSRREGDLLLCGGIHKKLRRLYREAGIPVRWRERMPLLCDGEGIVWAPFVGVRDHLQQDGEGWLLRVELPIQTQ